MWPFKKPEPDTREPSAAAIAVAESLSKEPQRWTQISSADGRTTLLTHDSGIQLDTWECWFNQPWCEDEPDANKPLLRAAVDQWIAARLTVPAPEPLTEPAQAGERR